MDADRVGYAWHLACSDPTVTADYTYSRGNGWPAHSPPAGHVGASLHDKDPDVEVFCGRAEWRVLVAFGHVTMTNLSTKFYPRYMTQLLMLLKKAIPLLHGYVSCPSTGHYWVVLQDVRLYEHSYPLRKDPVRHAFELQYNESFPPVHTLAYLQYESARLRHVL